MFAKEASVLCFFSPIQYEMATAGGSELLVHHIQWLLESDPKWVLVKPDIKTPLILSDLNENQNNHDDVSILAYLDDGFILGSQEDALKAFFMIISVCWASGS